MFSETLRERSSRDKAQRDVFKPNVIFIFLFLYKKHGITGKPNRKKKTKAKHAFIYSMVREERKVEYISLSES